MFVNLDYSGLSLSMTSIKHLLEFQKALNAILM